MSEVIQPVLLVGRDQWLSSELDQLRRGAEEWIQIRADERTPGRLYEELRSFSFFGLKRTVCFERVDKMTKDETSELDEAIRSIAPGVTLVMTAAPGKSVDGVGGDGWPKLDRRDEPSTAAGAVGSASRQSGVKLDDELKALMTEVYGDQPQVLRNELEKLSLLVDGRPATVSDWRSISAAPGAVDGWRFARAVMGRDLTTANEILETWTAEGGSGHTAGRDLLGAVGYVLRQYLLYKLHLAAGASRSEAARRTPGRFGPSDQSQAAKWTVTDIANALNALRDLDRGLKRYSIPADLQLYQWCVRATAGISH